jgi:hypothetical protein
MTESLSEMPRFVSGLAAAEKPGTPAKIRFCVSDIDIQSSFG